LFFPPPEPYSHVSKIDAAQNAEKLANR